MNRFFRTAYSTTFVYLCLTFFGVLITGVSMPFPAFSCLYFGLLLFLLPGISQKLAGKGPLFYMIAAMTAISGLLPIAFWHCPMIHYVIHLSGIAAAVIFLSVLRHRTTHRLFLANFRFSAVSLFILIGFVYLLIQSGFFKAGKVSGRYKAISLAINSVVPYAIVLLASGVLLLRGLRAQPGRMVDEQVFNRRQLRDTLLFTILVTLAFAVDPFTWLGKAISFLFYKVLQPSFRFLAQLLGSLLSSVSHEQQPAKGYLPTGKAADLNQALTAGLPEVQTEPNYIERFAKENDPSLSMACVSLAAALILCILAFLIWKLIRDLRIRSQNRRSGYPKETYEKIPLQKGKSRKGKPKKRNSDPREQIRYLYGEFLHYLHKHQVQVEITNTCGEILNNAEKQLAADPSVLSDLTVLYEETRYRMEEMPAEGDAHVMKDLLDRIRKMRGRRE